MKTNQVVMIVIVILSGISSLGGTSSYAQHAASEAASSVVLTSEVEWEFLNPARGDMSPMAGTLWGDRNGIGPTGFLLKPTDGFESPPHIHNVSYRGVVISGLIHNDDSDAASMWMPAGSFWTQPKGEVHITAAKGSNTLAYIEIEEGPYLVRSTSEAFDSGERPVNVDRSNVVWLNGANLTWVDQSGREDQDRGPQVAFLWGSPQDNQLRGIILKLPAKFAGLIRSSGSTFRAVVIQGKPDYTMSNASRTRSLEPGSYFSSRGESVHEISTNSGDECIIYVRTDGAFEVH